MIELNEKYMKGEKPGIKLVPGCWIAGGAIRRWYSGEEQDADVDIFFKNKFVVDDFLFKNNIVNLEPDYENDEIIIYAHGVSQRLQLILDFGTKNVEETLNKFDFTICQFALDHTGTIYSTPTAQCDVNTKQLRIVHGGLRPGYEVNLMRRAFKYHKSGYSVNLETIMHMATVIHGAKVEDINDPFPFLSPDQEA